MDQTDKRIRLIKELLDENRQYADVEIPDDPAQMEPLPADPYAAVHPAGVFYPGPDGVEYLDQRDRAVEDGRDVLLQHYCFFGDEYRSGADPRQHRL